MKNLALLILSFVFALLACEKNEVKPTLSELNFNMDTLVLNHSMKGWELYTWKKDNYWYYSLLIGTNRNKSVEEIINNKLTVASLENLKLLMEKLPQGENIMLSNHLVYLSTPKLPYIFTAPPNSVLKEISNFCAARNLNFDYN